MLLALISAAFAGEAAAAAARVDFTTPGVTVAGRDGQARPLAKGAELDNGDTVRTNDGRVQLRFTDGSYVSLQPNTDFAISDYKYEGKSDDRGFFGLVRGAMRTVTGAVGRVNRNAYRINTPTATIGVRGTGGVIQVLNDGSTLVIGTSGIWSLTNPAGSIDIPAGVSGLAPTQPNTPPKETSTQPQTGTAPVQPVKTEFKKADDVDEAGNSEDLVTAGATPPKPMPKPVLVSGPGFQLVAAFKATSPNPLTNVANQNGGATFDASGQMLSHAGSPFVVMLQSGGSHAEFGTDGILAWGRWIGSATVTAIPENYLANSGFHYVVGTPTSVMPTVGGATYNLMGATSPTDGSVAGTLQSGSLVVNFASYSVTANLQVSMPSGPAGVYTMSGTTTNGGSVFSITSPTVTGSGGACTGSCSGKIEGFFAGASAERAGVGYHINDSTIGRNIFGAAAFTR